MAKTIAVWGSPYSGKTTFATKLARSIYEEYQSTVIILYTDMETPTLPVIFPNEKSENMTSIGKALAELIADASAFIEIGAAYAKETVVGFASLGGVTCGVIASNANENGGVITCDGAKKAARMISLCDSFSIPVVTLVDSVGVEVSGAAEGAPLASQLGKLAMAYATADTAKITVVIGKAYGAAFTLLGSKALGADMVFALPASEISVMAPASAVAFLWNDKITPELSRADLEEKWIEENASPVAAAEDGSIDDVIAPAELRQRICAAVYMLMMKNAGEPRRKHCNLPL